MRAHDPTPRRRGRPRDPDRETRILEATIAEYAERGWSGLTMDAVARRARVGKSTIYLRWSDREGLLVDAFAARSHEGTDQLDTGSLRGDLEALARRFHGGNDQGTGRACLRLLLDVATAPGRPLDAVAARLEEAHRSAVRDVLARAVDRGEVEDGVDAPLVARCLHVAMALGVVRGPSDPPVDDEDAARRVVDLLMSGLTPRLLGG